MSPTTSEKNTDRLLGLRTWCEQQGLHLRTVYENVNQVFVTGICDAKGDWLGGVAADGETWPDAATVEEGLRMGAPTELNGTDLDRVQQVFLDFCDNVHLNTLLRSSGPHIVVPSNWEFFAPKRNPAVEIDI